MVERVDADVCVVGAGYAGLTAARRLSQGSKSVVVLEARDRIGGRIWTHHLSDGSAVDRGGGWLGPKHDAIFGLAHEMGVGTYKTYVKGAHLLVDGQRTRRYTGLIPKISPLAIATIALAQLKIDRLSKQVPLDEPWTAKRAAEWDSRSVAWWLERSGIRTTIARPVRDGGARLVHRRPQRRVVPAPAVPGARTRQHQHAVLDHGWLAGEHGRRRRRARSRSASPTTWATRCA